MTRSLVIAITFMLLGPLVPGPLSMLMFSTAGTFTMGPGAILARMMYFFFWLPSLYLVYALPFLLTGILCALASRFHRLSLLAALASAAIAFSLYLGVRYQMFGTWKPTGSSARAPGRASRRWSVRSPSAYCLAGGSCATGRPDGSELRWR
jgi:hypothetical protein